jgi:hypothetical protein
MEKSFTYTISAAASQSGTAETLNLIGFQNTMEAGRGNVPGSTGLTLWESSIKLCDYICDNPHLVRSKTILELGCGIGLLGIVCDKIGARKVILTDRDVEIGRFLDINLERNNAINCSFLVLEWGNYQDINRLKSLEVDLVVGGDLIYDGNQSCMIDLFNTVKSLAPNSDFYLAFYRRAVAIEDVRDILTKMEWGIRVLDNQVWDLFGNQTGVFSATWTMALMACGKNIINDILDSDHEDIY